MINVVSSMINNLSLSHTQKNSLPLPWFPTISSQPAYHLSHEGFEPLSVQPSSASLVHILVSQCHETTG